MTNESTDKIPHMYNDVNLGHAIGFCTYCGGTYRENNLLGDANHCPERARAIKNEKPRESKNIKHISIRPNDKDGTPNLIGIGYDFATPINPARLKDLNSGDYFITERGWLPYQVHEQDSSNLENLAYADKLKYLKLPCPVVAYPNESHYIQGISEVFSGKTIVFRLVPDSIHYERI